MRFVCDSCRAQYMISDDKVGPKGVKVRCKKCGYVILVRKAEAAPQVALGDAGDATQVMSNPLAELGLAGASASAAPDPSPEAPLGGGSTQPHGAPGAAGVFASVEEDEIGAVFDQVLRTGPHPVHGEASKGSGQGDVALGDDDDRLSTRVLDSETVRKLAEESGIDAGAAALPNDWYVAIDDKQTGPLAVEKLKDLWDRGEIGPDSLCWRAGFSDWMPLSEVTDLASVLAPKPAKPTIVAPAAAKPAVVTVPVESAFSAGGVTKTVRSEVPMLATAPVEESGGWKPSAASALASLVKEEIDALSKPPSKTTELPAALSDGAAAPRGLLDLPSEPAPNGHPAVVPGLSSGPAVNGGGYGQGGFPAYRPPPAAPASGLSRGLVVGLSIGGVAVLALVGILLFLVLREKDAGSEVVAQATSEKSQPVAEAPAPAPAPKAPDMPPPPKGADGEPLPRVGTARPEPEKLALKAPPPERERERPRVARQDPEPSRPSQPPERRTRSRDDDEGDVITAPSRSAPKLAEPEGSEDEFNAVFGVSDSRPAREAPKRKKEVYVPPAVGGGADIPDSLGPGDVMQVVLAHKPSIAKCVNDQKAKDPELAGTLMMRWNIQTNGRTSGISVQSDEFKSTVLASCITGLVRKWQFPKHKNQGDPINFPFKF